MVPTQTKTSRTTPSSSQRKKKLSVALLLFGLLVASQAADTKVAGSAAVVFHPDVSANDRADVMNMLWACQQAADGKYNIQTNPMEYYSHYQNVMRALGWSIAKSSDLATNGDSDSGDAALDHLNAVLSQDDRHDLAGAVNALRNAYKENKLSSQNYEWGIGGFQIGVVNITNGVLDAKFAAFHFHVDGSKLVLSGFSKVVKDVTDNVVVDTAVGILAGPFGLLWPLAKALWLTPAPQKQSQLSIEYRDTTNELDRAVFESKRPLLDQLIREALKQQQEILVGDKRSAVRDARLADMRAYAGLQKNAMADALGMAFLASTPKQNSMAPPPPSEAHKRAVAAFNDSIFN